MMKKTALIAASLMMFFLPAGCSCAAASPEPSEKTIKREL